MSPLETEPAYDFCSVYSRVEAAEPLHATSTRADIWLLLEYTGPWEARAFPASDLSPAVKEHVDVFREETSNTRIQFIRKSGAYQPDPIHFYAAISHVSPPRLYAFELDSYEDLLEIDLAALTANHDDYRPYRSDEKLFLVCNNGRRDACCAKFGIPVHAAVEKEAGEHAWKSTHIGGHRLGPNLLFLPHAISYGRATPEDAAELVATYRRDELYLPLLRGRTIYDRPVQAALHFLRQESGNFGLTAFEVGTVEPLGGGRSAVTLVEPATERRHRVVVEARRFDEDVYKTCNSDEPAPVEHFYLLEIA